MNYSPRTYAKALAAAAAGPLSPEKERAIMKNFVHAVTERGDRRKLPAILETAERLLRQKEGLRKLTFESARPIKDLPAQFKGLVQKDDIIEEKVDPSIVAGVKVTMNDTRQFDGSLRKKLNALFTAK